MSRKATSRSIEATKREQHVQKTFEPIVSEMITDDVPERTSSVFLELTDRAREALISAVYSDMLRQQRLNWREAKLGGVLGVDDADIQTPIDLQVGYYELLQDRQMNFFKYGDIVISFTSNFKECPSVELMTLFEALQVRVGGFDDENGGEPTPVKLPCAWQYFENTMTGYVDEEAKLEAAKKIDWLVIKIASGQLADFLTRFFELDGGGNPRFKYLFPGYPGDPGSTQDDVFENIKKKIPAGPPGDPGPPGPPGDPGPSGGSGGGSGGSGAGPQPPATPPTFGSGDSGSGGDWYESCFRAILLWQEIINLNITNVTGASALINRDYDYIPLRGKIDEILAANPGYLPKNLEEVTLVFDGVFVRGIDLSALGVNFQANPGFEPPRVGFGPNNPPNGNQVVVFDEPDLENIQVSVLNNLASAEIPITVQKYAFATVVLGNADPGPNYKPINCEDVWGAFAGSWIPGWLADPLTNFLAGRVGWRFLISCAKWRQPEPCERMLPGYTFDATTYNLGDPAECFNAKIIEDDSHENVPEYKCLVVDQLEASRPLFYLPTGATSIKVKVLADIANDFGVNSMTVKLYKGNIVDNVLIATETIPHSGVGLKWFTKTLYFADQPCGQAVTLSFGGGGALQATSHFIQKIQVS